MQLTPLHSSASSALQRLPASAATAPRWMWGALGFLAASVVALAATVAVQMRGPAEPAAMPATSAHTAQPLAQGFSDEKQALPRNQQATNAINSVANTEPRPTRPPQRAPAPQPQQGPADRVAGAGQGMPVAQPRPVRVCGVCGQVESVQAVQQAAPATGVGAVAGGVLGAVVGNQVGKGNGRKAATVLGAVGGGYAGHQVEKNMRTRTVYDIAVRMEDGSLRRFQRAEPVAVGTPITLQGKGFRVGGGAAYDGAEGMQQSGMVRTGG